MINKLRCMIDQLSNKNSLKLLNEYSSQVNAIKKSMGVIEFNSKGIVLEVNDNFAQITGYTKAEIIGQHHRMFVDKDYANTANYQAFWKKLGGGLYDEGQYKRFGKANKEIWLQATYNPVFDENGKLSKIVKLATDITQDVVQNSNYESQMNAINKIFGVIEFSLDGTILAVNQNFLNVVGYTSHDLVGHHHRILVSESYAASSEYSAFWARLVRGEAVDGEFQRCGRGAKEIWLQASYNPILNKEGKPYKVVKYATDITAEKIKNYNFEGQLKAINKIQAVIEFDVSGNILNANENFLNAVGYQAYEVVGNHHSMFVEKNIVILKSIKSFGKTLVKVLLNRGCINDSINQGKRSGCKLAITQSLI